MFGAVGGGGAGVFAVAPQELTQAARQAEYAADAIGQLPAQVSAALSDAASLGGLELGLAVGDALTGWQQSLRAQAAVIQQAADRLRSTASAYASTEDGLTFSINRVHQGLC
jgi:hypothetical protein